MFRSGFINSGSGSSKYQSGSRSRVLMTKNWERKNYCRRKKIYLSLASIKESKLQQKPSALQGEHPALQNMKLFYLFSFFVGHFCPPGSGFGSTDLTESGSGSETLVNSIVLRERQCTVTAQVKYYSSKLTCGDKKMYIVPYGFCISTVPRRLFFTALQWIAIAQGPKIQQKNKL